MRTTAAVILPGAFWYGESAIAPPGTPPLSAIPVCASTVPKYREAACDSAGGLSGRHPESTIHADGLAGEVAILDYRYDELRIVLGCAEALWEGDVGG